MPGNDERSGYMRMRRQFALLVLALAALTLSSCAKRNELPVNSSLSEDDDTFCRAGGKVAVGSPEYVPLPQGPRRPARQRDRARRQEAARSRGIYAEQSGPALKIREVLMNENVFNTSLRSFLKKVGIASQREIERSVPKAYASVLQKGHEK